MERKLLDLLVCPATRQPLAMLDGRGLQALNTAIEAGGVVRGDGEPQAAVVVAVADRVCMKFSEARSALTSARVRPSSVASTVPRATRSPSATRQSMRTRGSSARWQASNHGRPQTTASSLHSR